MNTLFFNQCKDRLLLLEMYYLYIKFHLKRFLVLKQHAVAHTAFHRFTKQVESNLLEQICRVKWASGISDAPPARHTRVVGLNPDEHFTSNVESVLCVCVCVCVRVCVCWPGALAAESSEEDGEEEEGDEETDASWCREPRRADFYADCRHDHWEREREREGGRERERERERQRERMRETEGSLRHHLWCLKEPFKPGFLKELFLK